MSKRILQLTAGAGWLLLAAGCSPASHPPSDLEMTPPRRVVLVTIDTLRADHLHSYGYPREMSPFIDGLASRGVQFMNVVSQMPTTAPSHASIFTSLYPFQHGLVTNYASLDESALTMAEIFRSSGFQTAGFSSVGFLKNLQRGFDFFEFLKPHEKLPGSEKNKPNRKANETIDLAVEWIRDKQPSDRFFVWIHLFDVHQWIFARDSEPEYVEKAGFVSEAEEREWRSFLAREHGIPRILEADPRAKAILRYDSQLLFVDRQLERFFEAMESRGLDTESLWIIASDHGEGLWNHDEIYHSPHLYEEQLRVPLILFAPDGGLPGRRVQGLVRLVDLLPTLVDLVRLQVDAGGQRFAGRSLIPLIQGNEDEELRRYAFSQRHPKDNLNRTLTEGDIYSLQDLEFKYIYHSEGPSEFYDLRKDPLELDDRIAVPSAEKERFVKVLETRFRPLMAPAEFPSRKDLDEDTLRELEALGYIR